MPLVPEYGQITQDFVDELHGWKQASEAAAGTAGGHAQTAADAEASIQLLLSQIQDLATAIEGHAATISDAIAVHNDQTDAHHATSAPTASRIALRDSAGRARFGSPVNAADAATKGYVDTKLSDAVSGVGVPHVGVESGPTFNVLAAHANRTLLVSAAVALVLPTAQSVVDELGTASFVIRVMAAPGGAEALIYLTSAASGARLVAYAKPWAEEGGGGGINGLAVAETEVGIYRPGMAVLAPFWDPAESEWGWYATGDTFAVS